MRRLVIGLVISGSALGFGFTGTAHASLKSDCNNGDQRACEKLLQQRCVDELRKEGFTRRAAERECR